MADPVAASGAASPFRAGTVLRPPRPSLLDAVAHSGVLRALAAWGDSGGGQPPLLLDGTAGNGHDCLFLARQAPAGSLLLALDIQEAALRASRARLEQAGMAVRCCASAAAACALPPLPSHMTDIRLVLHSHAALPELLDALPAGDRQRPLLAGIFNFGAGVCCTAGTPTGKAAAKASCWPSACLCGSADPQSERAPEGAFFTGFSRQKEFEKIFYELFYDIKIVIKFNRLKESFVSEKKRK